MYMVSMMYWVWYYVTWLCVVGWCSVVLYLVWMVTALLVVVLEVCYRKLLVWNSGSSGIWKVYWVGFCVWGVALYWCVSTV